MMGVSETEGEKDGREADRKERVGKDRGREVRGSGMEARV